MHALLSGKSKMLCLASGHTPLKGSYLFLVVDRHAMKFGRKITTNLYDEWRPFYIDYNLLKRELKSRTTSHSWDDKDERDFTTMLKKELDKVHDFQKQKSSPIHCSDPESHQARPSDYGPDEGSDDDDDIDDNQSDASLEDLFHGLQEEVATLVADVHDLALYTKLNITGFLKILKKHDLSKLYDLVRTRGHPVQGDSSAGGNQSAFVHPDNLVPLKLAILRHLPVLVFNAEKEFEQKDA
ncbi:uncharacterized protein BJ212DRAFT_1303058, partial [Suillus subaureus]